MKKLFYIAIFCFFVVSISVSILYTGFAHAEQIRENSFMKWREWISSHQDYLDSIESLMKKDNEIEMQQAVDLQDAINKKDKALGDNILTQNTKRLSAIVATLKALTPPKEFKDYHDKITTVYQLKQMANEATLKKNLFNIKDCSNKAITAEIEAMESIKKLYISHGAPSQIIDSINRGIASYSQRLATN